MNKEGSRVKTECSEGEKERWRVEKPGRGEKKGSRVKKVPQIKVQLGD